MATWLSRLRSSSKSIYTHLRPRRFNDYFPRNAVVSELLTPKQRGPTRTWWSSYMVPVGLSASGVSLALQIDADPSFCDAFDPNTAGVGFGGKISTGFAVKGSHKNVPQELIDDLRTICGENLTLDHDERFLHGKPQNSFHMAVNIPDVVVFPRLGKFIG